MRSCISRSSWSATALAGVLASFGSVAGAESVARFQGPVDAPDVIGGFQSGAVIVRVAPGAVPLRIEEGWTFGQGLPGAGSQRELARRLQAAAEDQAVSPAMKRSPSNAARASALGLDRYHMVRLAPGVDPREVVAALAGFGPPIEAVELVGLGGILGEPPQSFPNDPFFGSQYGLHNTGQTIQGQVGVPGADINAAAAWSLEVGSPDIVIAIIDTGVSNSHPDLNSKFVPGWNTVSDNANSDDSILISHGSHCAGIAAAVSNNGLGVAGVAWGCKIMPVKVLNFLGGGTEPDVAEGIIWAADHGAHIGSMSLGYPGAGTLLENAINYAAGEGMVLVAATGNTAGAAISAPAKYSEVIAVGATDNQDVIASFTSTGPEMSVTAPGVNVYSCWDTLFSPNTYSWQSGTSMACPHVAGLAGLVWSANPDLARKEVREIIESTAHDLGAPGWDPIYGHGRIDAFAAVQRALASRCGLGDLDCDGIVDASDLGLLLGAWGSTGPGDLDGSGVVDSADVGILLGLWTP